MLRSVTLSWFRGAGLLLAFGLLTACSSGEPEIPNPYNLTTDLRGTPSIERTWVEPAVARVASLSGGPNYTLYNPTEVQIGDDGRIYVFDYGNMTVKGFTPDGEYVATYGRGKGRAPGQFVNMPDLGVRRDSLVYVVDGWQRRVSYFDRNDGTLVRTERYEEPLARLEYTVDSVEYRVGFAMSDFLVVDTPQRQRRVSYVTSHLVRSIVLAGRLHEHGGRAVYVPSYFPVIFRFSPADTTGVAYLTPDYGEVPLPEARQEEVEGRLAIRPPETKVHDTSTLHDDLLSIQRPLGTSDSVEFDLYDVGAEITYRHSVRLPVRGDPAVYGKSLVVAARDTTVHVYRLENPRAEMGSLQSAASRAHG